MAELRCPECGATPPPEGARFCHECGAALAVPEAPPAPPPPPPEPSAASGGGSRLLGPAVVAVAGAALLVAGILAGGNSDSEQRPPDALRASGILDTAPPAEDDIGPAPPGTVADFSSDHSGTPSTLSTIPALDEWQVALSESFADNELGWPTGDSGNVTRTFVDGRYRVAIEGSEGPKIAFTWRSGIRPPVWFRLRADVARHGGNAAACGLGVSAADGYPWVAVVVDDTGQRYRALARETADADIQVLLDWTELPDLIVPDRQNGIELIGRDDGLWIFLGDLAVAKMPHPLSIDQVGMVLRSPGGGADAACEFDDLLVSWP